MPQAAPEQLFEMAAFTCNGAGGNPAGVWLGPELPDAEEMQSVAARLGHSETAFVAGDSERLTVRYYSPLAEVSFCGHATIASGVVLGRERGAGEYIFETAVGDVPVDVSNSGGQWLAALRSVATSHTPAPSELLGPALDMLGWTADELDPTIRPAVAYAGAHHLILAARDHSRLDRLEYPFESLADLMHAHDLTTLHLVWRASESEFHARDPFPVGGVVEDPATGAAAAAFGGYLRDAGIVEAPTHFTILQGVAMGRPSRLHVEIPADGGIVVSGSAAQLGST